MKTLEVVITGSGLAEDLAEYIYACAESVGVFCGIRSREFQEHRRIELTIQSKFESGVKGSGEKAGQARVSSETGISDTFELYVHCASPGAMDLQRQGSRFGKCFDYLLVEFPEPAAGSFELGLERFIKGAGARKVLFCSSEEDKVRAFRKVFDRVLRELVNWKEVRIMHEEIPDELVERIKEEAVEGKLTCTRAHELAQELGLPLRVVGRACDIYGIKIIECELGCF